MDVDPGQITDVSAQYPKVVENLRGEYEKWWDIVSKQFDNMIPIHIGNYKTTILSQDMRNDECVAAWGQHLVRKGLIANGYWEILVEDEGEYEFELRRWPESHERGLAKGIEGDDIEFFRDGISEKDWFRYTGGVALPIDRASIRIQGIELKNDVAKGDVSVSFTVPLKAGECLLYASFGNEETEKLLSPYFIHIKKVK